MIIYSTKIIHFISEIKSSVKEILTKEIGLKVHGERFYDTSQQASYPIKIVIYNTRSMLGYFDPNFYELGFHESLMHTNREQLRNLIRHELAHYMNFIQYGAGIQSHAGEFKAFCQQMGWSEEVSRATFCLEQELEAANHEESSVLRKVQKLMALAGSSNSHEAEQAMIKSQQLLLKHNLESKFIDNIEEEKIVLKRIMKQRKENAKMRSIARILETFFVCIVYRRAEGFLCLEILGNLVNVEIAEYVANFLEGEMERLWDQARQYTTLKGMTAKNSFFLGIAKGYCQKIQSLKREHTGEEARGVMVIEKKLLEARSMVYQRLSSSRSYANHCGASASLGEQMGRKLSINPALSDKQESSNQSVFLISCFQK